MSGKHTPIPWRSYEAGSEGARIMPNTGDNREDTKYIAIVNGRDTVTDFANAAFIVRACNCHDDLLEVLKLLEEFRIGDEIHPPHWLRVKIMAAIRKAEGFS